MNIFQVRCHITDQDLDIGVLALTEEEARRLVTNRLEGIDHDIQWVSKP